MFIVLAGNPLDGLQVYGPFVTAEEADRWAEREFRHGPGEYWITKLERPEDNAV